MFKPERCTRCGDCLVECQWMEVDRDQAVEWIQQMMDGHQTPAISRCITCYACNEICPEQANPFDLIAELQEKCQTPVSKDIVDKTEVRYAFSGDLRDLATADRVLSECVFGKTDANLLQGELYEIPRVGGKPYFCWVLFSHMSGESVQRKHARAFVERLAATGAKEIVCFHDDCYAMLARIAPDYGIDVPFRPVHLSEYLVEVLKANKNRIEPLNLDLAYQRPCASRHTPDKEHFIDELFELVGVRRVERRYDRKHALCCAGAKFFLGMGDPKPDQDKNILDAEDAGAKGVVCLCPMCIKSLAGVAAERRMPLIFLGDLARMALGEMEPPA